MWRKISILSIIFLFLSSFASADWPTYQHDVMNTGHTEESLGENLRILWIDNSTDFGDGYFPSFLWNTPIYANSQLFITDALGTYLYSINATNGKMIWRCNIYPGKYTLAPGSPAYSNNTVFAAVTSYDNPFFMLFSRTYIYAVNATTGKIKWKTSLLGVLGLKTSIKSYKNRIFIGLGIGGNLPFGVLYQLDAQTGKIIWKRCTLGAIVGSICIYNNRIYVAASPATYGQVIPYIITNRFRDISAIYCFDMSGTLKWMRFVIGQAKASISASYGTIYFESLHYFNKMKGLVGGIIYAFNATTGKIKWKKEIIDGYARENDQFSDIAIAYGKLFFNGWFSSFCLDAFTGNMIWHINLSSGEYASPGSPPSIDSGVVYVAVGAKIKVINVSTGKVVRDIELPYCKTGIGGGFAIGDGKLFRATFSGHIYAFHAPE